MGKAALAAITVFAVMGAYYANSSRTSMPGASSSVADRHHEAMARGAAVNGFNLARLKLSESFVPQRIKGEFALAQYGVEVSISGSRATVTSVGRGADAEGKPVQYRITSDFERRVVIPDSGPSWMQYALITEGDLRLTGDIEALVVSGTASNDLNANFHTNGSMSIVGNSVDVRGFGTYYIGIKGNEAHINEAFSPNFNPIGKAGHYRSEYVEIPDFDLTEILGAVGPNGEALVDDVEPSSLTLEGAYDFGGTRTNPYVVHVRGDLSVTGNTSLAGYVMFVVEGDVEFAGDFTNTDSGYSGKEESALAIYAAGNVAIRGTVDIEARIFAEGEFSTSAGTPTITGSIVSNTRADLKGTPSIIFRPPSAALSTPWIDVETEIQITGYSESQETACGLPEPGLTRSAHASRLPASGVEAAGC